MVCKDRPIRSQKEHGFLRCRCPFEWLCGPGFAVGVSLWCRVRCPMWPPAALCHTSWWVWWWRGRFHRTPLRWHWTWPKWQNSSLFTLKWLTMVCNRLGSTKLAFFMFLFIKKKLLTDKTIIFPSVSQQYIIIALRSICLNTNLITLITQMSILYARVCVIPYRTMVEQV